MRNKSIQWVYLIFAVLAFITAIAAVFVAPSPEITWAMISAALGVLAIGLGINSFYIARHADSKIAETNAKIEEVRNLLLARLDTLDKRIQKPDE